MSRLSLRDERGPRPPRRFDFRMLVAAALLGIPLAALSAYNACKVEVHEQNVRGATGKREIDGVGDAALLGAIEDHRRRFSPPAGP